MDPDEVEPTGAHSHDLLTDNPRSPGGGGGDDRWACRLLRRGCDLARKAAIAGAAATAAPVVAPPLIVLSVAGVALSVPFAAYLASLAATNYLTGALLRACQPPSQPYHYQEYDDGLEQEFLDASEAYGQDAPAFGHFNTDETGQGEEDELDTALLLPRDHGSSEASSAADAEEGKSEFSARNYGQDSYASANPLFPDEDSQVQGMGQGQFSVLDSGQQSFQSEIWSEKEGDVHSEYKEGDGRPREANKSTNETLSPGFDFPESPVPASGDKNNVVQEKGGGEFPAHNSGQYSLLSSPGNENEQGMAMEEKKSAEEMPPRDFVASEPPAPLFHGEEKESDTSLLLPGDHGVSEALVPAFADEAVGEFSSVQQSGLGSYTSNRSDETEEHTPMMGSESTGMEVPPRGIGVSASAKPLFSGEDDLVQEKGEGGFCVHDSGQKSSQSKNQNKEEEEDGKITEENKSTKETLSEGSNFPEPPEPIPGGDDDNMVQEKGGVFFVQNPGQQSFQSKNWSEKEEDDGKTREENKSNKETLSQGLYFPELCVPASSDKDNTVQEKGEVELSSQNLGQYSLLSNTEDKNEEGVTMEEKKSTEDIPPRDFAVSESSVLVFHGKDDVVLINKGFQVSPQKVPEEASSKTNLGMGEVADVQLETFAIAAPESEVLPRSDLVARESPADLVKGGVVDVDVGVVAGAEPESEVLHPTSESPDDPVTGGSVDVQLEIISAASESEVLPPSNTTAHETPSDLVTGEVFDVDIGVSSAVEPESEVLHTTSESPVDPVTGENVDVQVDTVAAAAPGSEVLPLSSLAACESQAVAEIPHVGEALGINVTKEIGRDFGDISKEEDVKTVEENKAKSTDETMSQGFYFPRSSVPSSGEDDNVVEEKGEGVISAQNSGQYSLPSNTGDEKEQDITMEEKKSTKGMPPRDFVVSGSSVPVLRGEDNVVQSKEGFDVAVQEVMEEANSTTGLVMGEVADVQVEIIAIAAPETESEVLPPSNVVARELLSDFAAAATGSEVLQPSGHATSDTPADPVTGEIVDVQVDVVAASAPGSEVLPLSGRPACESEAVAETALVGEVIGITVLEDIIRNFDDVNKGVSFVPVASVHDDEDVMSSGSTPYLSTVEEEMIDQPNQSTGVGSRVVAGGEADYTEEQLREQLDTIRTITGYGAVPSSTLEGELAGLYIFVGVEVEPAAGSGDVSHRLVELNAKLRFLKAIVGVD